MTRELEPWNDVQYYSLADFSLFQLNILDIPIKWSTEKKKSMDSIIK